MVSNLCAKDRCRSAVFLLVGVSLGLTGGTTGAEKRPDREKPPLDAGRELFTRQWLPDDSRSNKGDGLGPLFNDTSCVACHNQGGVGGGGASAKNVLIASVFRSPVKEAVPKPSEPVVKAANRSRPKSQIGDDYARSTVERDDLAEIHPGFLKARSVVVHRHSTNPQYYEWRAKLLGKRPQSFHGTETIVSGIDDEAALGSDRFHIVVEPSRSEIGKYTLLFSQRNTPALFGTGVIDRIPDRVLQAAAEAEHKEYPEITGRVARLAQDKIGRFGWKAQMPRLKDFVHAACAAELGLQVPGNHQAALPYKHDHKLPGLDLTQSQCDSLTAFVASLPAPRQRIPATKAETAFLEQGQKLFHSTGCAQCHTPDLGDAKGIYSDLLLHDMGPANGGAGGYGIRTPNSSDDPTVPLPTLAHDERFAAASETSDDSTLTFATSQEWRTPPLWGVRDSAPYWHDGRAGTLEHAVALHHGEASRSMSQYLKLPKAERLQLVLFLQSLAAPE